MNILRSFQYKYIRNQNGIVKVNQDSLFVQTYYGPVLQCYMA